MEILKLPVGAALLRHVQERHGFYPGITLTARVGTSGYKALVKEHREYYHGRHQDQQDHTHPAPA